MKPETTMQEIKSWPVKKELRHTSSSTRKRCVKMLGMRQTGPLSQQIVAYRIGAIYELPEVLALDWIRQGIAEDIKG